MHIIQVFFFFFFGQRTSFLRHAIINHTDWPAEDSRNLFSNCSGDWKSETKAWQLLIPTKVPGEKLLHASPRFLWLPATLGVPLARRYVTSVSALVFVWHFSLCFFLLFFQGHRYMALRAFSAPVLCLNC